MLLAIPDPVVGAYIVVLISILFVLGLEMVAQDGIDYRKATIIGVSFWIGAGFQSGQIPSELFGTWAGSLLGNGMTSGGLTAILLSTFMELSGPRRRRIETGLNVEAQPKIQEFLERFAARARLSEETAGRVSLAAEETLLVLLEQIENDDALGQRRLRVTARAEGSGAELEFLAAAGEGNIEDRMAFAGTRTAEVPVEQDFSLRLLRHVATSVRHQKYHDTDIVSVRVEGATPQHVELPRELDDERPRQRSAFHEAPAVRIQPVWIVEALHVVVDDEEPRARSVEPAETEVGRPAVGLVAVLHQRLQVDAGREEVPEVHSREQGLELAFRQVDVKVVDARRGAERRVRPEGDGAVCRPSGCRSGSSRC